MVFFTGDTNDTGNISGTGDTGGNGNTGDIDDTDNDPAPKEGDFSASVAGGFAGISPMSAPVGNPHNATTGSLVAVTGNGSVTYDGNGFSGSATEQWSSANNSGIYTFTPVPAKTLLEPS